MKLRGLVAGIDYDRIQAPYIVTYPGSSHVLLLLSDVRPEARMPFIAPLADAIAEPRPMDAGSLLRG